MHQQMFPWNHDGEVNRPIMKNTRQRPLFERSRYLIPYWGAIAIITCSILMVSCNSTPDQELPSVLPWPSETPNESTDSTVPSIADAVLTTVEPDADGVELLGASIASDGRFVIIYFKGPTELIQNWWEGSVYVIDEITDTTYYDIPTAPVIGPFFAKPIERGQVGYVMLNNPNYSLIKGSIVTVVLGTYMRQHVQIK